MSLSESIVELIKWRLLASIATESLFGSEPDLLSMKLYSIGGPWTPFGEAGRRFSPRHGQNSGKFAHTEAHLCDEVVCQWGNGAKPVTEWWIGGDSYGGGGTAGDSVAISSSFSATPSGFGKPVNRVGGAITDPASHTTGHAGPHPAVHTAW